MNFLDNMPYFDNFVLDSLVLFGGGFLIIFGIGIAIRVGQILYAIVRASLDKFIETIKRSKKL